MSKGFLNRCKFKEENWQNNTNLRGEDSATDLLTLLSTGPAVKNENEVTRLACELALLALGNSQEWLKAEIGSCKDYGRQLVVSKTIAGKGDVCKQSLFDSAYNTANLFGPIPTILSEKVTSDLNGSRYHVDFHPQFLPKLPISGVVASKRTYSSQAGNTKIQKTADQFFHGSHRASSSRPNRGSSRGSGGRGHYTSYNYDNNNNNINKNVHSRLSSGGFTRRGRGRRGGRR